MRLVLGGLATLLASVSCALGVLLLGLVVLLGTRTEPHDPFGGPLWQVAVWYGMPLVAAGLSALAFGEGTRLARGAANPGWYLLAVLGAAGPFYAWYVVGGL